MSLSIDNSNVYTDSNSAGFNSIWTTQPYSTGTGPQIFTDYGSGTAIDGYHQNYYVITPTIYTSDSIDWEETYGTYDYDWNSNIDIFPCVYQDSLMPVLGDIDIKKLKSEKDIAKKEEEQEEPYTRFELLDL